MISCHSGSALTVFSVNAGYWFTCSLGGFAASFLIPMRNVVVTAQALGILILHEKRLLTLVRFDVINVAGGFGSTLNCTFSALRLRGKPVPLDRLPNGRPVPRGPFQLTSVPAGPITLFQLGADAVLDHENLHQRSTMAAINQLQMRGKIEGILK